MYVQTLYSNLHSTQAERNIVQEKFGNLANPHAGNSKAETVRRYMSGIDTLSGAGSAQRVLDGLGIKVGDVGSLDSDAMARLSERLENRYQGAIKSAAGDTTGAFSDIYGRYSEPNEPAKATVATSPGGSAGSMRCSASMSSEGSLDDWFGQWLAQGLQVAHSESAFESPGTVGQGSQIG